MVWSNKRKNCKTLFLGIHANWRMIYEQLNETEFLDDRNLNYWKFFLQDGAALSNSYYNIRELLQGFFF